MSDYTNAPATKMLATHCGVCNRPLLDAASVLIGIGPDCRKKYMGAKLPVTEEARKEANQLVYQLALAASGAFPTSGTTADAAIRAAYAIGGTRAIAQMLVAETPAGTMLARLTELGFDKLVAKLETAWIHVKVEIDTTARLMRVTTPFNELTLSAWRNIPGSYWDKATKTRVVPCGTPTDTRPDTAHAKVWALLKRFYPGHAGIGPKGPFVIPTV